MSSLFDLPFEEPASDDATVGMPDDEPPPPAAEPQHILTVSELTARLRVLLEERFTDVWVEGELSNCRVWNTGHLYFTLKDARAQIRGVMFRKELQALRFKPHDGMRVLARGRISIYDQKGEYQVICEHLEPEGLGARQLAFDQLKKRLEAEGLFDPRRKRPLPALPRKIGVVTSLDGAAVRDIIKVLQRRYPNAHVVIRPTRVQGDGAALDIARALSAIGKVRGIDVVIVARGGGSLEDLWAFNEEVVARALGGCTVPVISGVGHQTDFTIADFVADVRAATPSNAAEIVVGRKDEFCAQIDRLAGRVTSSVAARIHRVESRLRAIDARPSFAGFRGRVAMRGRHAAELGHALDRAIRTHVVDRERAYRALRLTLDAHDLRRRLGRVRTRLVTAEGRLDGASTRARHHADGQLRAAAARLDALSPLAVLGRGYAVCWTGDRNTIVRDASTVKGGDRVRVTLARGELDCSVVTRELPVVREEPATTDTRRPTTDN